MPLEIERKFLIDHSLWKDLPKPAGIAYRQGYLACGSAMTVRIRIAADQGYITIKGPTVRSVRSEFEYEIPAGDAIEILEMFRPKQVEKTRYRIHFNQKTWEVDEFHGENEGLILAEIELDKAGEDIILPGWVRKEVTEDPRYYNSFLAENPYNTWGEK
jgi:adenylate cyclase